MKKQILSILLNLCMVLMLCPVTAFAEGDDTAELEYMLDNAGEEPVVLERDYTITSSLELSNVTLDLNGHVIRRTGNSKDDCVIYTTDGVTLQDSNPEAVHSGEYASLPAGGVITIDSKSICGGVYVKQGIFTMTGGTIYGGHPGSGGGAGVYVNGGKFTMSGGAISGGSAYRGGGVCVGGGSFTMTGGAIYGCYAESGGGVYVGSGSFTMTGGAIYDCSKNAVEARQNTTIFANGGSVKGVVQSHAQIRNTADDGSCTRFYGEVRNCADSYGIGGPISGGVYYGGIRNDGGTVEDTYHTVSFNLNDADGSIPTQWFVNIDTAPALKPANPTKDGYKFTDWYSDEAFTEPYDFDSAVTESITLYAGFIPATYTVTYDPGEFGTGSITAGDKTHGKDFTLSDVTFTRQGYVQIGWSETDGGPKDYKLGGIYSTDEDVTLYPVWDEIVTVTAPFTTTVKLGGNTAPGKTVFTLETVDSAGNRADFDGVEITAAVTTKGAGSYKGAMTITGPLEKLEDMLLEGAFVKQVDEGKANWTYDDTVWALRLSKEPALLSLDDAVPSYSLLIYQTTFEETGNGKYYNMDLNKGPLNEMRFTNTYTKSTVKTTKSTRPSESSPNTTAVESTQTGDSSSLSLWLALLAVSASGVIGTGAYSKRKKSSQIK